MAARICRFFIANKYRRCDCFSGRFLFYRNLQTITLRWKLFSVLIFMLSEMFSEETAQFRKIALSATILSLRELFRRIKTPSRKFSVCKCRQSFMRSSFVKRQRWESYTSTRRNTQNSLFFSILYLPTFRFQTNIHLPKSVLYPS